MEESLLRTIGLTKRNLFWLPCQKQINKSPKKVDCKTKNVMETFNGKRFPKQSGWHAGCFDNDSVKNNLPWFGKQTARSLKIGKRKLFLTELFTQTFVCTDTKQLKKTLIKILTRHSEQFSHNVPEKIKRWEFFCEKSCSLENPLEILIAVSRNVLEKLGQKSKKKVTQNRKSIENSWLLRIEIDQSKQTSAQKIGTFQNPGNSFLQTIIFFSAET